MYEIAVNDSLDMQDRKTQAKLSNELFRGCFGLRNSMSWYVSAVGSVFERLPVRDCHVLGRSEEQD